MKLSNLSIFGLQARLALGRLGWITNIAGGLIVLGVCAGWWGISYLAAQTNAPQMALHQAQEALRAAESASPESARSLPEERLSAFYDLLGDPRYTEQQVKTLFTIAAKVGLVLNQAEYKSSIDKNGRTTIYQIVLPVKGTYQNIRKFAEQTLLSIPFASLDEVSFKRDTISSGTLEAKLHFTLFLNHSKTTASLAKEAKP